MDTTRSVVTRSPAGARTRTRVRGRARLSPRALCKFVRGVASLRLPGSDCASVRGRGSALPGKPPRAEPHSSTCCSQGGGRSGPGGGPLRVRAASAQARGLNRWQLCRSCEAEDSWEAGEGLADRERGFRGNDCWRVCMCVMCVCVCARPVCVGRALLNSSHDPR